VKTRTLKWLLLVAALAALPFIFRPEHQSKNLSPTPAKKPANSYQPVSAANPPLDEASSLWVIVNKGRALPAGYTPSGLRSPNTPLRLPASTPEMMLRSDAATALEDMTAAAKNQGINLMLASGYRSYQTQVAVHDSEVRASGTAAADAVSARPGHSEHQTGLAADLEPTSRKCEVEACFAATPEGQWLAANAYKYGFIIRYQQNTSPETGYSYEPWHVRYLGKQLAATVHSQNVTLERYFKLPFYTDYPAQSLQLKG
jgi:zinc D-Ala-D-Ala carboxypeptidase